MRIILLLPFVCISFLGFSQKEVKPTSSFIIIGRVKAPLTIRVADLQKLKRMDIGDVMITNHTGEPRGTAKALKGILLKEVLSQVQIDAESPKVLSEYYFVCKAEDGYTVIYSWNEIFNTVVGDSAFIITEKEGVFIEKMEDSILMISSKDLRTGRRYVKALATIEVKRAQ